MPTEGSAPEPPTAEMGSILDNLGALSDDQFFQRLSALRAEHKRTLMHYEKLYHEKLMAETGGDIGRIFGEPLFATTARQSADGSDKPTSSLCVQGTAIAARSPSPEADDADGEARADVPVVAEIPDAPKLETMGRDYSLSVQEPVNTGSDTFNHTLEVVRRSADKPPRSPCPVHKCKEAWTEEDPMSKTRRRSDSSCDEKDYSNYDETRYSRTKDAALDRIEAMWDDFHLSEYKERPKSASRRNSADYWRNRITIPEPFHMTIRDESKDKEKSRTLAEYEHQKALKEMEERFECERKFRATPVPAHVYMPLYEEIMEKAESRRRANVQVAKEVLKSQDKPFQFNERKKIPDHGRRHSAPQVQYKRFKAKPIPKAVRDDVSERILEEEEYRKIRIRMRSKELLRESSLPPRMASREQQYTVGKLKEKIREQKEKCEPKRKFQPRIKKNVPDFETIHRKQRNESANRYKSKPPTRIATVCEPFSFESSKRSCDVDKILKDMEKDEEQLNENRWPYKNPRAKPKLGEVRRSYDSFPTGTTTANDLRQSKNYSELRNKTAKELQNEKNREQMFEMAKQRRKQIAEKARANDQTQSLKAGNAERLRQYREEERRRLEDYKRELAAMEARVSKQPFLFERQSQVNARKRAEKQFEDALRKAGVDDDSLSSLLQPSKGPRAPEDVPTDEDLPTRDTDLNATYDKNSGADDDDDKDYHYSHSFVEEDVDDDDDTRKDSIHENLQDEIAA